MQVSTNCFPKDDAAPEAGMLDFSGVILNRGMSHYRFAPMLGQTLDLGKLPHGWPTTVLR